MIGNYEDDVTISIMFWLDTCTYERRVHHMVVTCLIVCAIFNWCSVLMGFSACRWTKAGGRSTRGPFAMTKARSSTVADVDCVGPPRAAGQTGATCEDQGWVVTYGNCGLR